MNTTRHIPVLLHEAVNGLQIKAGDVVVDATFGGGGHALALLKKVGVTGRVIAFDRDRTALERFQKEHNVPYNLVLIHANYSDIAGLLQARDITEVNAILADLGFSSDQIEEGARGFSFLHDGPLDMRLDQSQGITAAELIGTLDVSKLARLFRSLGEEPESLKIAKAIIKAREEKVFTTTRELADCIEGLIPKRKRKGKSIHPATRIFQALRIAVNQEREHLVRFLESTSDILAYGGRIAVISFHSGEDRLVKQFLANAAKNCVCPREFPVCRCNQESTLKVISKKGIKPSTEEMEQNPRSRSAILRIAERV